MIGNSAKNTVEAPLIVNIVQTEIIKKLTQTHSTEITNEIVVMNDNAATPIARIALSDRCSSLPYHIAQFLCLYSCVLPNAFVVVCVILCYSVTLMAGLLVSALRLH